MFVFVENSVGHSWAYATPGFDAAVHPDRLGDMCKLSSTRYSTNTTEVCGPYIDVLGSLSPSSPLLMHVCSTASMPSYTHRCCCSIQANRILAALVTRMVQGSLLMVSFSTAQVMHCGVGIVIPRPSEVDGKPQCPVGRPFCTLGA